MPPTIRIIVRCGDDGRWLRATIDSILDTTRYGSFEVLVSTARDLGTDLSFLRERAYAERVTARVDPEGPSTGRGLDEAVEAGGEATYSVFLDGHCVVSQPEWLQQMIAAFEQHPDASMVQPEVVELPRDDEGGDRARHTFASVWAWPYDSPSHLAEVVDFPASAEPYEAMAGTGVCAFVRSATFRRLGGFDPEIAGFRALTMDYCIRAWLLGAPTIVDPRIRILHRRDEIAACERERSDSIHAVLKTAYKYFSPRRRDVAEGSFRAHGLDGDVDRALARIQRGPWLEERVGHERARVHDDDWLFDRFHAYEKRYARCE